MYRPFRICLSGMVLLASAALAELPAIDIELPEQDLATSLQAVGKAADIAVFFESMTVQGKRAHAIAGKFAPREALNRLLAGSGLTVEFTSDKAVAIKAARASTEVATELSPMEVKDVSLEEPYVAPIATTATKTDTPVMETPLSIQVVPRQVMEDQQAYRLEKALNNVSGVISAPESAMGGTSDSTVIRGFQTYDAYSNGFRVIGGNSSTGPMETANIDRIEVLKGPAAILYGRIEPGGIVNLVKKEPQATAQYSVQQLVGSYDTFRTTADATGPLTARGDWLYRLDVAHEDADSFQDYRHDRHDFVSGALRWIASPDTKIDLGFEYKHARDPVDYGIPVIGNRPVSVPLHFSPNDPGNGDTSNDATTSLTWSHAFDENWSAKQTVRWRKTGMDLNTTEVIGVGTLGVGDGPRELDRTFGTVDIDTDTWFTSLDLMGKFQTWGLGHTLLVGADYNHFDQRELLTGAYAPFLNIDTGVRSDLGAGLTGLPTQNWDVVIKQQWYGIYLQDQIKLLPNVQVLAGLRYDHATNSLVLADRLNGPSGNYDQRADDQAVTPRFGILWQPAPEWSLYANYVKNFGAPNNTNVNSSLGTVPAKLSPEKATQKEIGVKSELYGGRLTGTVSVFELTKDNIAATDPTNPNLSVLVGQIRNHGIEADISGEIVPGWRAVLAASMIDTKITKDAVDLAGNPIGNQGHQNFNVPRKSASLWTTYDIGALRLGGGVIARSQSQGDLANSFQMPGYAILNLMAAYRWKVSAYRLSAQLNIDNVLNRYYFANSSGFAPAGANVGAPRTFIGSLKVDF